MKRLWLLVMLVGAPALLATPAFADEREVNFVYVPAPNAESIVIDQPLGGLELNGWDKPEVRIVAKKHAPDNATLDQLRVNVEMADGHIRVRTGVRTGKMFMSLPGSAAAGIDLSVDVPRNVELQATTWAGDLDASGFRAGAALSSRGGDVRARDIQGDVKTNALKGKQHLSSIRGNVEVDGVTSDVDLDVVEGELLEVKVVEGQVTARRIRTPLVRLFSAAGDVVLIGALRPGARYELGARAGDVKLLIDRAPFSLDARAPAGGIESRFALEHSVGSPTTLRGDFLGGGPQLELTSLRGRVVVAPGP